MIFYYFLIVPREGHTNPCYDYWVKCLVPHFMYAIFHFFWPWTFGVPYARGPCLFGLIYI